MAYDGLDFSPDLRRPGLKDRPTEGRRQDDGGRTGCARGVEEERKPDAALLVADALSDSGCIPVWCSARGARSLIFAAGT